LTWKSKAHPPRQDCKTRATESSVGRKRWRRKVARRKKDPSGQERGDVPEI
jgi:ribosomal protein L4